MEPVPLLDLRPQYAGLREAIDHAVRAVIESQKFILGPEVEQLEAEVARFVGVPFGVGCASGTDALILSLAALGVGPGDRVATSPFSFTSSASCAYHVGARPAFVDIRADTFNLDPERLDEVLDPRVKALIPVHLFGQCADMESILEIAARHGTPVVEDAAQALGATYRSSRADAPLRAGALGALGCFSFFPSKNLGGFGDGGMIVGGDPELADTLRKLRIHGGLRAYDHERVGWNSRLDALQAAVLRVKLPHLESWCRARAENAERYDGWLTEAGLVGSGRVRLPHRDPRCGHIFNQYTLRVENREDLRAHLERRGVGHAVYYPIALHLEPCFRDLGHRPGDFPEAESAAREVISLPIYPELRREQQERVVAALVDFYRGRRSD